MRIKKQYFLLLLAVGLVPTSLSLQAQAQDEATVTRIECEALLAKVEELEARLNGLQQQQVECGF